MLRDICENSVIHAVLTLISPLVRQYMMTTNCLWPLARQARSSMQISFHGCWSMMLRRSRWMHERTTIIWPSEDIVQRQSHGTGCNWNRYQFRMLSRVAQCLVNHGNEQQLAQRNKGNRVRGPRERVSSHVKFPGNWKNVLRNDDNKDELSPRHKHWPAGPAHFSDRRTSPGRDFAITLRKSIGIFLATPRAGRPSWLAEIVSGVVWQRQHAIAGKQTTRSLRKMFIMHNIA